MGWAAHSASPPANERAPGPTAAMSVCGNGNGNDNDQPDDGGNEFAGKPTWSRGAVGGNADGGLNETLVNIPRQPILCSPPSILVLSSRTHTASAVD